MKKSLKVMLWMLGVCVPGFVNAAVIGGSAANGTDAGPEDQG